MCYCTQVRDVKGKLSALLCVSSVPPVESKHNLQSELSLSRLINPNVRAGGGPAVYIDKQTKLAKPTVPPQKGCTQDMRMVRTEVQIPICLVRASYQYGEEEDEGLQARRTRFMDVGLVAVGIRRLNELLEDDIDTRKKKENVGSSVRETVESRVSYFRAMSRPL